jgi:cellulose synthase/poly-beta-1,6-N-acetylglucosamine synthase-like glycosyltransferase
MFRTIAEAALTAVVMVATIYVAIAYLARFAMIVAAWREAAAQRRYRFSEVPEAAVAASGMPTITVIVPAFNEELSICRTVESLLSQAYLPFEVIVISDGSTDRTLGALLETFDCIPVDVQPLADVPTQTVRSIFRSRVEKRLTIIDKRNGGKADALNVGINYSSGDLLCVIDADVILERWALYYLALPFVEDPATVASSGTIRLHNGCRMTRSGAAEVRLPRRWLERFQVLEYTLAFGIGRLFFNLRSSHVVISGAFGLFSRQLLVNLAGFQPNAIGEDMELVVRIHRHLRDLHQKYRIVFVSDAICYTEAPTTLRQLGTQRTRWHQGLLTTLRLHKKMIGRPRYGVAGMFTLPYFLLFELVEPVFEAGGWAAIAIGCPLHLVDIRYAAIFFATSLLLGTTASWAGVFLDDEYSQHYPRFSQVLLLASYALLEHFGYHQAMLFFRLRAFPRFYGNTHLKGGWVSPTRQAALAAEMEGPPGDGA